MCKILQSALPLLLALSVAGCKKAPKSPKKTTDDTAAPAAMTSHRR